MPKLPRNLRRRKDTGAYEFEKRIGLVRFRYPLGSDFQVARGQLVHCRKRAKTEFEELQERRTRNQGPPRTFGRFWREKWLPIYARANRSEAGVQMANYRLETYAGCLDDVLLEEANLEHFLLIARAAEVAKCKPRTVGHVLSDVRCVFSYAKATRVIAVEPSIVEAMPVVPQAVPRPVPEMELAAVIRQAPEHWAVAIGLASRTGMRYSEQRGLIERLHVSWEPEPIIVIDGLRAKSSKTRVIPLLDDGAQLLRRAVELGEAMDPRPIPIFGWMPAEGWRVRNVLMDLCTKARVPRFTWHQLRHTAATRLLDLGLSESAVRSITGHSSDDMLHQYARRTSDSVRRELSVVKGWGVAVKNAHENAHEAPKRAAGCAGDDQ